MRCLDSIPDRFLDCPAERLAELLPGPCLIDLPGREPRPLFVSVLLHGNEDTGLAAAQEVLRRHRSRELHRSLLLFVGNVAAAAANVRTLPAQADYNRVWPGTLTPDTPEAHMARWVFDYAAAKQAFASIDIHNNTGLNPHYACITRLEPQFIALARVFSRTVVHFERPLGVHAGAFGRLCPAITVECGKAGGGTGAAHAVALIEACLSMAQLPSHDVVPHDVDLFRTYAIVKSAGSCEFFLRWVSSRFPLSIRHRSAEFQRTWRRRVAWQDWRQWWPLMVLPGDGLIWSTYISIIETATSV